MRDRHDSGVTVRRRTSLPRDVIALLRRACAMEQQHAIKTAQATSARHALENKAATTRLTLHRRAIRELKHLAWIDRDLLPASAPIAAALQKLKAVTERAENVRKAIPGRPAHRPGELPHLLPAIREVIENGESPARVMDYVFRRLIHRIPYLDTRSMTRAKLLDRVRRMK